MPAMSELNQTKAATNPKLSSMMGQIDVGPPRERLIERRVYFFLGQTLFASVYFFVQNVCHMTKNYNTPGSE